MKKEKRLKSKCRWAGDVPLIWGEPHPHTDSVWGGTLQTFKVILTFIVNVGAAWNVSSTSEAKMEKVKQ